MAERILIGQGEICERVLLNECDTDLHIVQQQESVLRLYVFGLTEESDMENHIVIEQEGKGCTTELYGLLLASANRSVVVNTHILHSQGGGNSEQLFKYILSDRSKGYFEGRLKIAPDAQQTSAAQTNRNLLLSPTAKMRTLPQLEIYADDVKASHGASTGQLDENALFYMRQRGLSGEQARLLLVSAFAEEVIEKVRNVTLKQQIVQMVEQRLSKMIQAELT